MGQTGAGRRAANDCDDLLDHRAGAAGRQWTRGASSESPSRLWADLDRVHLFISRRRSARQRYRGLVASTEHLDELRRRLAEQTDQGVTSDRVTTDRLVRIRRRLSELERISENTINEAEAMSAEEEVLEIMDSLQNVRELRPSDDGRA